MWTESLINIAICFGYQTNHTLSHTDVTAHKIVMIDDRSINSKQHRFPPFHKK